VIDNLTIVKEYKPPKEFLNASGRPFEYRGMIFNPNYINGQVCRYFTQIRNLRLSVDESNACLSNSIHKYWCGNNYSDFHLEEMKEAVFTLSEYTGINWHEGIIKKVEYGCNLNVNSISAFRTLVSYRGKDYMPLLHRGKVYGAFCQFTDYKIKGYDKAFQVKETDKIFLPYPIFRWEIALFKMRMLEKVIQSTLTIDRLLKPWTWEYLANDAVCKYDKSIKRQKLNLADRSTHEKRIIAEMRDPEIREDLKRHNKNTYKRDRRIYTRILADKSILEEDCLTDQLQGKLRDLIYTGGIEGKGVMSACNIVENRGNIENVVSNYL
jgi:hypothetical protein